MGRLAGRGLKEGRSKERFFVSIFVSTLFFIFDRKTVKYDRKSVKYDASKESNKKEKSRTLNRCGIFALVR